MRDFITKNFLSLIVIVLIVILLLQRCGSDGTVAPKNTSDTVSVTHYHYFKDTSKSKPVFIKGERDTVLENSIEYIPSQDYDDLYSQFEELKQAVLSKNVYKDNLKIDSFGTISITDTVQNNRIIGRQYINNLIIPEKTTTITNTIYPKPKNQFYIGGGVQGSQVKIIQGFDAGLMLKNKKDQIFGVTAGINTSGEIRYGVQSYWKIKLHK